MNTLIIVLGVILLIVLYYVYTIVTAVPVVVKNMDLTQTLPVILPSSINDPYSNNYTIATWVYISQFTPTIDRFLIYGDKTMSPNVGMSSVSATGLPIFSLRMDTQSNNLYADILVNKTSNGPTTTPATTTPVTTPVTTLSSGVSPSTPTILPILLNVTNGSFPIQKWVYITVSVSNNFVEGYLNGKFITAVNLNNNTSYGINGIYLPTVQTDPTRCPTFSFGGVGSVRDDGVTTRPIGCPVMLAQVSRWNIPLSAGEVYSNYMKGNGQSTSIFGGDGYHMTIDIKQGKNEISNLSVF
jgi:hypothetical protein